MKKYIVNISNKPLITVITVVYNGDAFLKETILSVINQSYDNIEYIIIDGGSCDHTISIIKEFESQIDFWISEPDSGIYDAMNKGLSYSNGDFVGFLNSGDILYPDTLFELAHASLKTKIDYTLGPVDLISLNAKFKEKMLILPDFTKDNRFILNMAAAHMSVFVSRSILNKIGSFNLDYKLSSDFEMLIRIIKISNNFYEFKNSIGAFREGGVSGSYSTYIENNRIFKLNNISRFKRNKLTLISIIKVFIIKNFPISSIKILRKVFRSGRYI